MGPAHLGVGFAAKTVAPKTPLWALLVASEALDLLSFGFIALGIERASTSQTDFSQGIKIIAPGSIPWSHGLFMSLVWSALLTGIAYLVSRDRRTSGILGLVVFSHWLLDFIVHPPDLPLFFAGSPQFGLGLWTSGPGLILSVILEVALLAGGIGIYLNGRKRNLARAHA
jgi:hypothetical protein